MKIERSKEWWMARARREGDAAVGAGLLAFDPVPDERPTTITQTAAAEEDLPDDVRKAADARHGLFPSYVEWKK